MGSLQWAGLAIHERTIANKYRYTSESIALIFACTIAGQRASYSHGVNSENSSHRGSIQPIHCSSRWILFHHTARMTFESCVRHHVHSDFGMRSFQHKLRTSRTKADNVVSQTHKQWGSVCRSQWHQATLWMKLPSENGDPSQCLSHSKHW